MTTSPDTSSYIDGAVKALAKLPNNAARLAKIDEKIEELNQHIERLPFHPNPPSDAIFILNDRVLALMSLRGRYERGIDLAGQQAATPCATDAVAQGRL